MTELKCTLEQDEKYLEEIKMAITLVATLLVSLITIFKLKKMSFVLA
jgi:hypothetical protein